MARAAAAVAALTEGPQQEALGAETPPMLVLMVEEQPIRIHLLAAAMAEQAVSIAAAVAEQVQVVEEWVATAAQGLLW